MTPLQLHTAYVPKSALWDDPYCAALAEFLRDEDIMGPESLARSHGVTLDDANEAARRLALRIGLDAKDSETVYAVVWILLLGSSLPEYL